MNNLLFTALIIALLYYFCYYLPQPKKLNANLPFKHQQATQTEPKDDSELVKLKTQNQLLAVELKTKSKDYQSQITQLQTQIRELAKRPFKPTNSKTTQTDDKSLTNTLDTLIKEIQELNNSL